MDDIAARSVRSVFIYTREARPGEHLGPHGSMADKRANARALRHEHNVARPILLDDLDGAAHHAWGPAAQHDLAKLVDGGGRGGLILYKAAWTNPPDVEHALSNSLKALPRRARDQLMPAYSERLIWRAEENDRFIELSKRAGPQAISDMYGEAGLKQAYGEDGGDHD
jgi:hypothetical protein